MVITRNDNIVYASSEQTNEIEKAIFSARQEIGKLVKSAINPHFKSSYVPLPSILDSIEEPLNKYNLSLSQWPVGKTELLTRIYHLDSDQWIITTFQLPLQNENPQGGGSSLTYMKRYAIVGALRLNVDDDDDGNAASKPKMSNFILNKNLDKFKESLQSGTTVEELIKQIEKSYTLDDSMKTRIKNINNV